MSDPLLRRSEVERETGMSRSTIYRNLSEGTFPKPIKTGPNSVRWRQSVIEKWKSEREAASAEA